MTFTEQLKQAAAPILKAQLEHPFVRGLADGTLAMEPFRYYMIQDTLYIVEYARAIVWAAALVPEAGRAMAMLDSAKETFEVEAALKETYFGEFGVTLEETLRAETAPTCQAYIDHLHRYTRNGTLTEALAAIIPCGWVYIEIGRALTSGRTIPDDHPYGSWLMTYTLPELVETVNWWFEMLEGAAAAVSDGERRAAGQVFQRACRYEWMFWEMAWSQERWRP